MAKRRPAALGSTDLTPRRIEFVGVPLPGKWMVGRLQTAFAAAERRKPNRSWLTLLVTKLSIEAKAILRSMLPTS